MSLDDKRPGSEAGPPDAQTKSRSNKIKFINNKKVHKNTVIVKKLTTAFEKLCKTLHRQNFLDIIIITNKVVKILTLSQSSGKIFHTFTVRITKQ